MKHKPLVFTPRPGQPETIRHLRDNPRSALYATVGSGKTVMLLTALLEADMVEPVFPILVMAPKNAMSTVWEGEITKFAHTRHLTTRVIDGTQKEKLALLKDPADVNIVAYTSAAWLLNAIKVHRIGSPWQTLILDESVKIKNYRRTGGSIQGRVAVLLSLAIPRVHCLSGLPAPLGIQDMWAQVYALDRGERLEDTIGKFNDKYMLSVGNGYDLRPRKEAPAEVREATRDICYYDDTLSRMAIPDPIIIDNIIKLPEHARTRYDALLKPTADSMERPASASMRAAGLVQIAAGFRYTAEENPNLEDDEAVVRRTEFIHDEKMQVISDILESAPEENVIVAYQYKAQLVQLREWFEGLVEIRDKPGVAKNVERWNDGKIRVLALQTQSNVEGLNLQLGGRRIIWPIAGYDLNAWVQVNGRISPLRQQQAGFNRDVYIHRIIAEDTIDEVFPEILDKKMNVNKTLFKYIKEEADHG